MARLIELQARNEEDVDCLMRELAVYGATRHRRAITIELQEPATNTLLALLTTVETCVSANEIRSVQIQLDGERYLLAPT